jgi:hypothetical protein
VTQALANSIVMFNSRGLITQRTQHGLAETSVQDLEHATGVNKIEDFMRLIRGM